ncbi:MAG: thiamine pyrophosphate-requiring protein [Acidimicrobiales bacterium]
MAEPAERDLTVAGRYLERLADAGIRHLFVNAGTDFAPIAEAYALNEEQAGPAVPEPVICTHENLAVGMAHGAYLVSGRAQAVMFHVSVGTANAVCGVTNAARDQVPLLVTAGRTPILEQGALGARDTSIHWAQEMFDQAGMVRELVKWDYELRDPGQLDQAVDRALALAGSHPRGPVYLTLPREVLAQPAGPGPAAGVGTAVPASPHPDPAAVAELADRLASARLPVVLTSAAGADPAAPALLATLAERYAIGVVEVAPRYLNLTGSPASGPGAGTGRSPMHLGYQAERVLAGADMVVVLEADVPWMPTRSAPDPAAFVAHAGVDPLYARYPMRTHRSDLTLTAGPSALLGALGEALDRRAAGIDPGRADRLRDLGEAAWGGVRRLAAREGAASGAITKAYASLVLGELLAPDDVVINEYWGVPGLLDRSQPGTYFYLPPAGGLGWAVPAALGARLAAPDRRVVALVGDGAYLFANPASCHHAAAKHDLPVLVVVANNATWGAVDGATRSVYPEGRAVAAGDHRLSDLSPAPDFAAYARASGGFGVTVTQRAELRDALAAGLDAVDRGRQALIDVVCVG